ncbi:hypothetical protein [Streptomyces sp. NPDC051286]
MKQGASDPAEAGAEMTAGALSGSFDDAVGERLLRSATEAEYRRGTLE